MSVITEGSEDIPKDVVGSFRDVPPTHLTFMIESFSLLSESLMEELESAVFEAGGYKWKILICLNGNKMKDSDEHISAYLAIADTSSLPPGWEINVVFKFLLFDQIRDRYLALGDVGGRMKRFHRLKVKWGFPELISLTTFKDPSNGYLTDDTCVFGADVCVCERTNSSQCLSMVKSPSTVYHTWKIESFSQINDVKIKSEVFTAGGYKWRVALYPKGYSVGKETNCLSNVSISLGLAYPDKLSSGEKVYARYVLRIQNQIDRKHEEIKDNDWFGNLAEGKFYRGWTHQTFMKLGVLNDEAKGFLVKDTCIVEAEVTVHGSCKQIF